MTPTEECSYDISFVKRDADGSDGVILSTAEANEEKVVLPAKIRAAGPCDIEIRTIGRYEKWREKVIVSIDTAFNITGIHREE